MACAAGICRLSYGVAGGLAVTALDALKYIALSLPVGGLTLIDASLTAEFNAAGGISRLRGTADMPFSTFGLLPSMRIAMPVRAGVALDLGRNLPATSFALAPDRQYWLFSAEMDAGMMMEVTGGTELANEYSLKFAPGQHLVLAIDTTEPVAYLDGQVTLSGRHQIAFLRRMLGKTPVGDTALEGYAANVLALRTQKKFNLTGKFCKNLWESWVTLTGTYLMDAGMLPAKLGIQAQLLQVMGQLAITRDAVSLKGLLQSAMEPEKFYMGGGWVELYLPLNSAGEPAHICLDADMRLPAAKLTLTQSGQWCVISTEIEWPEIPPIVTVAAGTVEAAATRAAGTLGPVKAAAVQTARVAGTKGAGTAQAFATVAAGTAQSAGISAAGTGQALATVAAGTAQAVGTEAAGRVGPAAATAVSAAATAAAQLKGKLFGR